MQARINSNTVFRLQALTGRPLLRGIDSSINECLDRLEKLEKITRINSRGSSPTSKNLLKEAKEVLD